MWQVLARLLAGRNLNEFLQQLLIVFFDFHLSDLLLIGMDPLLVTVEALMVVYGHHFSLGLESSTGHVLTSACCYSAQLLSVDGLLPIKSQ